jgi:hypothetical protein
MQRFLLGSLYWVSSLFHFSQVLHWKRARISEKAAEVQQCSCIAELEETNAQLHTELTAHTKVAEVERCERALTSDYADLRRDFSDLQTVHAPIVKEKADLEKTERDKAQ